MVGESDSGSDNDDDKVKIVEKDGRRYYVVELDDDEGQMYLPVEVGTTPLSFSALFLLCSLTLLIAAYLLICLSRTRAAAGPAALPLRHSRQRNKMSRPLSKPSAARSTAPTHAGRSAKHSWRVFKARRSTM